MLCVGVGVGLQINLKDREGEGGRFGAEEEEEEKKVKNQQQQQHQQQHRRRHQRNTKERGQVLALVVSQAGSPDNIHEKCCARVVGLRLIPSSIHRQPNK